MRHEIGHRYPHSSATKGDLGKWSAFVEPPVEGVHQTWRWAVRWPGHFSPKKRKDGEAEGLWEAISQADEFARSVGLEPQGELDEELAAEFMSQLGLD